EKKLKRKIKAVLVTKSPAYYNVDPHHYLIKIDTNSIVEKLFKSMQQDVTIVPYDLEKKQVCLYIYDKTSLCKTNFKLERLNEQLVDLSNKDPMTQAYNRRYFGEVSKKMLSLSIRNKQDLSLIILDIDKFKDINDTCGHSVGDDVIILLSNTLEQSIRESDISARFGGEEFVILFNNSDIENTYKLADEIRKKIESLTVFTQNKSIQFTVSIGVAQFNEQKDKKGIEETIKRADEALYYAKEHGRNLVVKSE
ncbi:MAG: GGDEF domain-containing protein, partial [Campylobacteraceae bacterium]|nr:GGDEF domain-containing protein [Campylobacteraceae bacterium]